MRDVCHSLGHVFGYFWHPAKSNDITNYFVMSIFVQKFAEMFTYDNIKSPEHYEITNKGLRTI